jgi:hypothetical protein
MVGRAIFHGCPVSKNHFFMKYSFLKIMSRIPDSMLIHKNNQWDTQIFIDIRNALKKSENEIRFQSQYPVFTPKP